MVLKFALMPTSLYLNRAEMSTIIIRFRIVSYTWRVYNEEVDNRIKEMILSWCRARGPEGRKTFMKIAIAGKPEKATNYIRYVESIGAVPVVTLLASEIVECRGLLLPGGGDITPAFYGERNHGSADIDTELDILQLQAFDLAVQTGMPVLGICKGLQIINVGLGGTIYQDIPSQFCHGPGQEPAFPLAHRQPYDYNMPSHTVALAPQSLLARVCGCGSLKVNSMHHQAVKDLAPGCIVSGTGPDGLIEAIEMADYPFFVGVQWHPEYLWSQDKAAANLFIQFIKACK